MLLKNLTFGSDVSASGWKRASNGTRMAYDFTYDGLHRLKNATYKEGTSVNDHYTEKVTGYDRNGNITGLQRYGRTGTSTWGIVDNLTLTRTGNQLTSVSDTGSAVYSGDFNAAAGTSTYNANGALTSDTGRKISSVTWNEIDLPQTVTFSTGSTINYYYAADGTKLREVRTVSGTTTTIDWCGDLVLEKVGSATRAARRLRLDGGYVDLASGNSARRYFVRDHLGSVRAVVNDAGTVLETDDYYPLGGPLPTGTSTTLQPEKYQGKEWNPAASFNVYDFGARLYDPALGRWLSQDPMAETYYLHSPYLFCAGNPMKFIDPEGRKIVVRHTNEDNTFTEYEWREQNDVWGFYDADGKLFDGTDSYIQDLNSSLLTLMEGANGSKMIKEIVASINRIVLENNEFNDKLTGNKYFSGSRSIGWSAIKSNSEPFISLGHELAHAMDDLRGTLNTNTWISAGDLYNGYSVPKDIPFSEVFATHYENLIRAEHGIPLRTGYLKSQQGTGMYFGPRIVDRKGQSLFFNSEGQTAYKLVNKNNRYRY